MFSENYPWAHPIKKIKSKITLRSLLNILIGWKIWKANQKALKTKSFINLR